MNADHQADRAEVLRRLEQQRQRIEVLFRKPHAPRYGMVDAVKGGFPRSQTMRLLISEPMFTRGLNAVTTHLLGPQVTQLLRALKSAFHAVRNASQERGPPPP